MPKNRYHFDIGNSNDGPIGFCAAVYADSQEEAAQLLKSALEEINSEHSVIDNHSGDGIDYVQVYFNTDHISASDIDYDDESEGLPDDEISSLADDHEESCYEDEGEAAFGRED